MFNVNKNWGEQFNGPQAPEKSRKTRIDYFGKDID